MSDFARSRVFLLLALAIAAVLAAASSVAFIRSGDEPRVTLPTAAPTTSLSPLATPSATATPTATESATATPTATSTSTSTATATSTATTASKTYAYPKPPKGGYEGLSLKVTVNRGSGAVGSEFKVTAVASDGDGTIYFNGLTWGDGTNQPAQSSPQKCKSWPPLHSPPGAYRPDPDNKTYTFSHRYLAPGRYTITVRVTSVNADCKPNGPATQNQVLQVPITVTEPEPTPTTGV